MITRDYDRELEILVAPWLPGATIDEVDMDTPCGCYSEWTTESCHLYVTFFAPWPAGGQAEKELSKLIPIIESQVRSWARSLTFTGCECCDSTDNPSLWVRVIPREDA